MDLKTTNLITVHEDLIGEIKMVACCKRGPITNENYCPYCGRKIIK